MNATIHARLYFCHQNNITGDIARGRPSSPPRSKLNLREINMVAAQRASKSDIRYSGYLSMWWKTKEQKLGVRVNVRVNFRFNQVSSV